LMARGPRAGAWALARGASASTAAIGARVARNLLRLPFSGGFWNSLAERSLVPALAMGAAAHVRCGCPE